MIKLNKWLPNQLGQDIWKNKYQHNNETLDEWFNRITNNNKKLKQLIIDKKFLFGGRILANRGLQNEKKITYSNCYVLPQPEDNLESIFDVGKMAARTFSYGGGVGIDISKLAPKGSKVNNAAEQSSGSVSFTDYYSMITGLISQNGRRGALMLSINSEHPDLEEFIDLKTNSDKVTKANISIRISDEFMKSVKDKNDYTLTFIRPETGELITKTVKPYKLFEKLAENNWNYAEPGILFWDTINKMSLLNKDKEFKFVGTNPCGEEPLPAGGSCLILSINLSEYVINPFTNNPTFDYDKLAKDIAIYITAMNEVLDEGLKLHPLQIQRDSVKNWRQIGLGIMGYADALIKLGLVYGSEQGNEFTKNVSYLIKNESLRQSALLAKEYGTYPKYNKNAILKSNFLQNIDNDVLDLIKNYGLRNSQLLTIAPTGSISTMLGVSGGMEPIFAFKFKRKTESLHGENVYYDVNAKIVDDYLKTLKQDKYDGLPKQFISSQEIHWKDRINVQSIFQSNIDASISSTINLPNDSTKEEIYQLYMYAWKKELKGLTVYRDGCKREGILTIDNKDGQFEEKPLQKLKRPKSIPCDIHNVKIAGSEWTVIIGLLNNKPYELFAFKNKNINIKKLTNTFLIKSIGNKINHYHLKSDEVEIIDLPELYETGEEEFTTRLVTRLLQVDKIDIIIKDAGKTYKNIGTFVNVIKRILSKYISSDEIQYSDLCPECGEKLVFTEGCMSCPSCGYSKCS